MNIRQLSIVLFILLLGFLIHSCEQEADTHPSQIDFSAIPFKTLSEYGFFEGEMSDLKPSEGVLLYEPIAPLFTDYAHKQRFVWMPEGSSASLVPEDAEGSLDFPDKSILIKNFYYPKDFREPNGERRIVETRLMIKREGEWEAFPYFWNPSQTDADYKIAGKSDMVRWIDESGAQREIKYYMPNKNQCKSCHNEDDALMPIGPKAKNLNFELSVNGKVGNQLALWADQGYLSGYDHQGEYPSMVCYSDPSCGSLDQRAKAYLDGNCGHCHNLKGTASTSGLYLKYEETDPFRWGVNKPPVAAGIGAGTFKYDVVPGQADSSIYIYRMKSVHPGIMMPELGRVSVHEEGVELIREWINSMPQSE